MCLRQRPLPRRRDWRGRFVYALLHLSIAPATSRARQQRRQWRSMRPNSKRAINFDRRRYPKYATARPTLFVSGYAGTPCAVREIRLILKLNARRKSIVGTDVSENSSVLALWPYIRRAPRYDFSKSQAPEYITTIRFR